MLFLYGCYRGASSPGAAGRLPLQADQAAGQAAPTRHRESYPHL